MVIDKYNISTYRNRSCQLLIIISSTYTHPVVGDSLRNYLEFNFRIKFLNNFILYVLYFSLEVLLLYGSLLLFRSLLLTLGYYI